jgi:hypothetical protein
MSYGNQIKIKRQLQKMEKDNQEVSQFDFHPRINAKSKMLASQKRLHLVALNSSTNLQTSMMDLSKSKDKRSSMMEKSNAYKSVTVCNIDGAE